MSPLGFLIIPYAIAGAWSYRTRGGGDWPVNLPRIVDLGLWGLLLALPLWVLAPWWAALIGVAGVMAFTSLGHGDFIDFGTSGRTDPDEWLSRVLHLFTDLRDGPVHDAIGMGLSGMTYTFIPAVIASYFSGPLWLVWLPIGCLKGASYALGWRLAIPQFDLGGTVLGEILTGFLLCGATGLLWWSMAVG